MTQKPLGRKIWVIGTTWPDSSRFTTVEPPKEYSDRVRYVFSDPDFEAAAREIYLEGKFYKVETPLFEDIWPELKKKLLEGE